MTKAGYYRTGLVWLWLALGLARAADPVPLPVRTTRVSSQHTGAEWDAARLVDGGQAAGAGWSSLPSPTPEAEAWCAILFAAPQVVTQVSLWAIHEDGRGFPAAFDLQFCTDDGATWYDVPKARIRGRERKAGERQVTLTIPDLVAKGLRIRATRLSPDGAGAFALQFAEVEARGAVDAGPFHVAPAGALAADLNNYWRIFGMGRLQDGTTPMLGGRKWWGIPVSASDCDWVELKLAWHDDEATLRGLRQWLLQIPVDPSGYVWAGADTRKHLNQHTLWHTNADFINALWECWRWNGDPAVLNQVPDYGVGIVAEDGVAVSLHEARDLVHFIGGDGMSLSQTFRSARPFRAARARIHAQERSNYELRLYAGDAAEPVARQVFQGREGNTNDWTALSCPAVQPAGAYRLELRNLKRYHHERVAWCGSEGDRYPDGTSGQNGLVGLSLLARARLALAYLLDDAGMRGRADGIVTIPDPDHTGTPQPTGRRAGGSMPSTYYDLVRSGHQEAFVNVRYLKALDSMAKLEEAAGDPARAQACREQLVRARAAFHQTFWVPETGRYAGWIDTTGAVWDYGEVEVNLAALLYAAPPPEAARSMLDWICGRRVVKGDTSQGADLYVWKFAPRKNTRAYETPGATNHWWGGWFWDFRPDGTGRGNFGNQEENGGTNPFLAYHDVLARLQVVGADDAWQRFAGATNSVMQDFHRDLFNRPTAADPNHPGERYKAYVMDLPEAGLPPLVMLHGFLGVHPDGRTLRIEPRLPRGVEQLGVSQVGFRGSAYAIEARADGSVRVQAGRGGTREVRLIFAGRAPGAVHAITIEGADGKPVTRVEAAADARGCVPHIWTAHEGQRLSLTGP